MQTPWKIKETRSDPLSDHRPRARGRPAHSSPMTLPKRGHRGWGQLLPCLLGTGLLSDFPNVPPVHHLLQDGFRSHSARSLMLPARSLPPNVQGWAAL